MEEIDWNKVYDETFKGMTFNEISDRLKKITDEEKAKQLRATFCNQIVYFLTTGYAKYVDVSFFDKSSLADLYKENVELLSKDINFLWAYYYFLKHNEKGCLKKIDDMFKEIAETDKDSVMNEADLVDYFIEPFKNGFDGFWDNMALKLKKRKCQKGLVELCESLKLYYNSESDDEIVGSLCELHRKFPELIVPLELIGVTYYSAKMWRNAIGYFEMVGEQSTLYFYNDLCWMLAWAYSKTKNYKQEEKYYRKCMEFEPDRLYTRNNLGYCLYNQKRYSEAKDIFMECLENKIDLPYAANNYVRVLIATGRNADAKKFVKSDEFKVSKTLITRVNKLSNTNARLKKDIPVEEVNDTEDTTEQVDYGIKRQQFSSEKILEDELTMRLENGMSVFGLDLKIFNREKDFYGRQYPFVQGRLDLLCEDKDENLYIIELKKDAGYDDAYEQTADYIDWFQKHKAKEGKKVYGIICLNNPTKELIEKVHSDSRMKLFEYQISYTEM